MSIFSKAFTLLQKVGQSLMIPVSVLPAAGLLVALGRILKDNFDAASMVHKIGEVFFSGGLAIFEQLPVIFAMGVAIGFTGGAGAAALAAGAGYFTLVNVLKVISGFTPAEMAINTGVFGGIAAGGVSAYIYNRYHTTTLPQVLGFFSGKRLVPILASAACLVLGLLLGVFWPPIQSGIHSVGLLALNSDLGPAMYAAGKRLLIPLGLHHVYYPPFLFEFGEFVNAAGQTIKGDSPRFFAGDPSAGRFMASEFPIMLFGLPMAALAMVLRAKPERRKAIAGIMVSAALTSIITGITEPIEFAFLFVAPILFVFHVLLAFLSGVLTYQFDIHLGYTFSASLIDFVLGFFNQKNSMSFWLIVGPIMGALYFSVFYTLIPMLNLKTPGRETEEDMAATAAQVTTTGAGRAADILVALGGASNIESLDACITRLRLVVNNTDKVNKEALKGLGSAGVMITGKNVQAIFGVESDKIKDQIKAVMANKPTPSSFITPIEGDILAIEATPDETFSQKILGEGYLIRPTKGVVVAPFDAEVMHFFPTKHAIALKNADDVEVLIHVGIDTVKMEGRGFKGFVQVGDQVKQGQKLIEFDLNLIKAEAKSELTPVVFTNSDKKVVISKKSNQQIEVSF
ncbi:MAG: PTS glucose transporter subunit IIA [Bdellovibrio sp. 28-41-41]|nr:MAG: PTS glucose transporter subunit IIA [Bdellovibrio sp. 28-41-41]